MSDDDLTRAAARHREKARERKASKRAVAPASAKVESATTSRARARKSTSPSDPRMRELDAALAKPGAQSWLARARAGAARLPDGAAASLQGLQIRTPSYARARGRRGLSALLPATTPAGQLIHPLLPDPAPYALDVSVVMGTYNRSALLQRAVASVRAAAGKLSYEVVVCDGGSTDGSRAWLAEQPDVVLVHGDLSGAVPAFNAAAAKARGRFIVCLNDDAELLPDALAKALRHFADPMVGQVAMAFHEAGAWKIDVMHGVPYGNFPVTRASIVRAATQISGGMWATCYRTYGGDNELSCWVYRLGYQVVVDREARVRHHEVADELRRRNTTQDTQRSAFSRRWPDATRMRFRGPLPQISPSECATLQRLEAGESVEQRWSRIASADPVPGKLPPRRAPGRERVLHWHLWTEEDPQASMAAALRSLGTDGHARVDWTALAPHERGRALVEAAASVRPTLVFLQLQAADAIPAGALRTLRLAKERDPSLVICVWSGDIGPTKGPWAGSKDEWQYAIASEVDLMLFSGTGQVQHHRARGMKNAAYLQIGYDVDRYQPGPDEGYGRRHSVVFLGQDYGRSFDRVPHSDAQLRRDMVAAMSRSVAGFRAYGSGFGPPLHQSQAGNVYRGSAMAVTISLTSRLGRYSSDRMIRSMACGCPTLVKAFDDMAGLGLVDGVNCLVWETVSDVVRLARKWAAPDHREQLRQIGRAGAALMREHHTWDVRMHELAAIVAAARGAQ